MLKKILFRPKFLKRHWDCGSMFLIEKVRVCICLNHLIYCVKKKKKENISPRIWAISYSPEVKRLTWEATHIYLESQNCNLGSTQIQTETQEVSQLQGESKEFLWEKEKNNYMKEGRSAYWW